MVCRSTLDSMGGMVTPMRQLQFRASSWHVRCCLPPFYVCPVLLCFAAFGQQKASPASPYGQTVTQTGTRIELTVEHVDPAKKASDPIREFENVTVRLRFTDSASGSALAGASPAAWIDPRRGDE